MSRAPPGRVLPALRELRAAKEDLANLGQPARQDLRARPAPLVLTVNRAPLARMAVTVATGRTPAVPA